MNDSILRIAHLSDLHFISTVDGDPDKYGHSEGCLRKIASLLEQYELDCLIITGDITDRGDIASLRQAYQWIHDQVCIDGEYLGLRVKEKGLRTIIVPGNHDAFNSSRWGKLQNRWQNSLGNYYKVFKEYTFEDRGNCVDYFWLSKNNVNVFVSRIDSTYLGGKGKHSFPAPISKIAGGKISLGQSEKILSLHNQGIKAQLQTSNSTPIQSGEFLHSLKMVVMHHYLFTPANNEAEKLLEIDQSNNVFQNLAMADFDILLCGHKHIGDEIFSTYFEHFDPRGKLRLGLNYLQRICGISELPLKADKRGHPIPKTLRFMFSVLYLLFRGRSMQINDKLTDANVEDIISILDRSLNNPLVLKEELKSYIKARPGIQKAGVINEQDISCIYTKIQESFSHDQLKRLKVAAEPLKRLFKKKNHRPFLQIMSASSAKLAETHSRSRGVNIYEISNKEHEYHLLVKAFPWDNTAEGDDGTRGSFSESVNSSYSFPHSRISIET